MDYEQVACLLDLGALVCYGFLILGLALYYRNEANVYLAIFCLCNGVLAGLDAFPINRDGEPCRWIGFLTMLAITLGSESLHRNQIKRKRMGQHGFRFYQPQPYKFKLFRSCIATIIASLIPLKFYKHNPKLQTCFVVASATPKFEETIISFLWILFFYLRPLILTIKLCPKVLIACYRQITVLRHERELSIDSRLLLYKDHHRRLYHTICTLASQINLLVWIAFTVPYVIQIVSLVAGLDIVMQLGNLSHGNNILFIALRRCLPVTNCFVLLSSIAIFIYTRLPSNSS